jgi:hypothetical protein
VVQTLISERAQISNVLNNHRSYPSTTLQEGLEVRGLRITVNTSPRVRYTPATTRSYPSTTCWKVWKSGDCGLYHHLCILIQVLVRFRPGSYRREYRPLQNPYPHPLRTRTSHLLGIRTLFDLLEPSTNPSTRYEPSSLVTRPPHLLRAFLTCYKTAPNPLRTSRPPYRLLRTCYSPCEPLRDPSTCYEPSSLVTRPLPPATSLSHPSQAILTCHGLLSIFYTLTDALHYTTWRT